MKKTVKLAQIGNSRGIRLSKTLLEHYGIQSALELETTPDAIVLRPIREGEGQLTWEDTYRQMAQSEEDWTDWEAVAEDGLDWDED